MGNEFWSKGYLFLDFLTSESGEILGAFILTGAARRTATGPNQSKHMLLKICIRREFSSQIVIFLKLLALMCDFEVVSYNVNGLGDDRKRRKICNYMKKHTSGKAVVFLQETHSVQKVENLFEYQWRGKVLFSQGTSSRRGACICFRYDLDYKTFEVINDKDDRYIVARMEIQGQPYVLINCYAPNSETGQVKIFKVIFKHLADMGITPDYKYICAGD